MSARPIVNDALWRCLCPSFIRPPIAARSFPKPQSRFATRNRLSRPPHRSLSSTTPSRSYNALNTNDLLDPDSLPPSEPRNSSPPSGNRPSRHEQEKSSLVLMHTAELYEQLRADAAAGRHDDVMNIVRILIKDRREKPNIRLYGGVLHSFVNSQEGTAGKVRKVLEEMREEGIEMDAGTCHYVLEALAVHPDYLLREEILSYMKERWFTLTDRGHNMVVAAMLRERLFEQAIQKIEDMLAERIVVYDWLLDKAIWLMLDYGEIEEAWNLLAEREEKGRTIISGPLWMQMLDVGAKLGFTPAIDHLWTTRVIPGYLKPPTSTCLHVLNHSARNGHVRQATDVFRLLSERNTALTSYHYEMLLETYLNANELDSAISVILIMAEGGIKVDEAGFHPLYNYLKVDEGRPMQAFDLLQNAEATGRKVPTAAINACIQASVQFGRLGEAVEIYKALHTISRAGPNTATFNILFQGCHRAGRKELALFLATEMLKLNIKPNALTYDRLVLVCSLANDLDDAFKYYEEMRGLNLVPRIGMFKILIDKGLEVGDSRVRSVLGDMKSCGYIPGWERMKAVRDRFGLGVFSEDLEQIGSKQLEEGTSPLTHRGDIDEDSAKETAEETAVENGQERAEASFSRQ